MSRKSRILALVMLMSVLLGLSPFASAAAAAPLKLASVVEGNTIILSVEATQSITLSNYDIQLSWDASVFTLAGMTNEQTALFSNFQKNVSTGKISAASSGENVTVASGTTLAKYSMTLSGSVSGTYPFTLTVKDAADEDGDALAWKGATVSASIEFGAAQAEPLSLSTDYDADNRIVSVYVKTEQPITLSNYDVQLTWDSQAFKLTGITNGQIALFSNFQKNVSAGKISAASGGDNVTVPARATLATYTFSVEGNAAGDYNFTLTVKDAADENGDALTWKGIAVQASLTISASSPAKIVSVSFNGSAVTITAFCATEGAILCCAAYKENGQYVTMKTVSMDTGSAEKAYTLNLGTSTFDYVKVFAFSGDYLPLCVPVQKTAS